ncbi:amidohydrolase [Halorhabdus sp. BNX81]|uniref:amidohydrolase n=1 Tax=Halorhabdus sp. BNX81 TaxID=2980181 RepID=UPI0023DD37AC|nr:amidohydrolase [Halorhabdus sp. BNX81]WEL20189.1 5-methylthioadenosine/S-adenosylhomocysteine deaminase [Halorhabdus sp. BNX81]
MSELLVTGGQVLRPDMTVERADVLVDQDAGTIEAVGDPGSGDDELDAEGGLVIPGLVNAHTHVAMTLLRGLADDKPLDAWLREDIWPVEAALRAEDVRAGTELGLVEMIKSGTTTFADMYFFMPEVVGAVEAAGLGAVLGYGSITVGNDDADARQEMADGLAFAREYDGAADGRIRTAFMPHSLTTVGEEYYREFVPQARDAELPIHLHANETDDEVEPILDKHGERPLVYADDLGLLAPEDFLAHGVHLDEREIELLAERGTGVVHCPASNMKLASGMAPVQDMLEADVTVGLGTDGAASNNDLDMFDEMRDAAMLGKLAASDASAVDAHSVVRMATTHGAELLGFDSGRIEPGANADLAVLDLESPHLTPAHDLVSHLAYAARGSDVRHTVADGQVLMRDREVTVFDEERVRTVAADRAEALIDRAT